MKADTTGELCINVQVCRRIVEARAHLVQSITGIGLRQSCTGNKVTICIRYVVLVTEHLQALSEAAADTESLPRECSTGVLGRFKDVQAGLVIRTPVLDRLRRHRGGESCCKCSKC